MTSMDFSDPGLKSLAQSFEGASEDYMDHLDQLDCCWEGPTQKLALKSLKGSMNSLREVLDHTEKTLGLKELK